MNIPQQKHIEFYEWQIQVLEEEWERYANTSIKILKHDKRLFVGRIWGIQETQGNVILRFKSGAVPRMKQPYILCLVGADAAENSDDWAFSYLQFRMSSSPRLSGLNSEIRTLNYLKSQNENWSYILVSDFDDELLSLIKEKYLDHKQHPLIVVAETDPPIDYLIKLKEYVIQNPNNSIINLDLAVKEESWKPRYLDNQKSVTINVIEIIEEQDITIIQGPPGTGKSYLAAELCQHYLAIGKSVCVTALTNKALMEIAEKEGLRDPLGKGVVFKTNLTSDELKKLTKLKRVESFTPRQGELLLTSYYKLAQKQADIVVGSKRFDLLIIEEASQSFLATIAMFSSITSKVLVIGDHKQLTPVVFRSEEALKIHSRINGIINGLQTFAFNNSSISNRLQYTKRLTSDAANLTGIYYDNSLKSTSEWEGNTVFTSGYSNLFHSNGGISIAKLSSSMKGFTEIELARFICSMGYEILRKNKEMEAALLSPYINIESIFYEQYSRLSSDYSRITINTIHKIQGLSCDVTILFLPLNNPAFDLDANLFNVGTSRAKRGTLIVTYQHIDLLSGASPETLQFVHSCKDVTSSFLYAFNTSRNNI
jgi:DNA replication ATP-dependent helicase Dna2